MLKHPWLDAPANYEYKYTERGYEVMMMKKELKGQTKGRETNQDDAGQEEAQEMNELVESDPELYGADTEEVVKPVKKEKKSAKDDLKLEIKNYLIDLNNTDVKIGGAGDKDDGILSGNAAADEKIFNDLFDAGEISLEDPEESRVKQKERKDTDAKIHNSFTGPYPTDPIEFGHTDTGENYQFTTVAK